MLFFFCKLYLMNSKILLLCACLLIIGCGGSSPRFITEKKSEQKKEQKKKGAIRFSSKVVEEETKEDDKKVNVQEVKQRFSNATSPVKSSPVKKSEKNEIDRKTSPPETVSTAPATAKSFNNQTMMDNILAWLGTPYEYGGETKSGIDCSAFTREMFKESAGIALPRSTEEQVKLGTQVEKDNLKFGDLIFFNTTGQNPSHVGIYIGDDMFAHASVSFGVTLSSMYSSYYKKRYTESRRIIN